MKPGLTRKPTKGDRIRFADFGPNGPVLDPRKPLHTVTRTPEGDESICWIRRDGSDEALPFIWRHRDGLNVLATIVDAAPTHSEEGNGNAR